MTMDQVKMELAYHKVRRIILSCKTSNQLGIARKVTLNFHNTHKKQPAILVMTLKLGSYIMTKEAQLFDSED